MEGKDLVCRGLQSIFVDAKKHYDYGKVMDKARISMSDGRNPCEGKVELMLLIQQLNAIRRSTPTDWCYEGYCLGVFIPHRARIDRYVKAYEEELKIHKKDCKLYRRLIADRKYNAEMHDLRENARATAKAEEDRVLKLKQMELKSSESMHLAKLQSDERIKQMVVTSMQKDPQVAELYKPAIVDYIKDIFKK